MKTEIFKDREAFLKRIDRNVNGVTQEFADASPNWADERGNYGCWDCSESAPLWQMDIRHRLDLTPNKTDAVSRLLFGLLYSAEDEANFLELLENHRDELQKSIELVRQIERERMVAAIKNKAVTK